MKEKINMFIEPIFDKKSKFHLPSYIKMKKLIRTLKKTSPDFNMLMEIYRFLSILEKVYMYSNSENHKLFITTAPNAFMYKENDFTIKFVLKESDRSINIEIERNMRSRKEKNNISFRDGEYIISNKYEEETFLFIIACIMEGLIELIEYYYYNKKF